MVISCDIQGIKYEIIFNMHQDNDGWHYKGTLHTMPELDFWCSFFNYCPQCRCYLIRNLSSRYFREFFQKKIFGRILFVDKISASKLLIL